MTNEKPQSKTAKYGRAAAWFAAGALGATALTGVAMATTVPVDDSDGNTQEQAERHRGPGGKGGPGGRAGGPGGPMLHSEGVIETPEGEYKDVVSQRGKVTEVSDSSITVASEDGYTANYTVNSETKIHKDRSEKAISDVAVGDSVMVRATKDGNDVTAKHIGALSPEEAAKMEERREEMKQKRQERREQRQNGETTESGFRGGPPAQGQTA